MVVTLVQGLARILCSFVLCTIPCTCYVERQGHSLLELTLSYRNQEHNGVSTNHFGMYLATTPPLSDRSVGYWYSTPSSPTNTCAMVIEFRVRRMMILAPPSTIKELIPESCKGWLLSNPDLCCWEEDVHIIHNKYKVQG